MCPRKCNALTLSLISKVGYHIVVFIVQCICINLNIASYLYFIKSAFVLFTILILILHLSVLSLYICTCDKIVFLQLFVEVKALLGLCYIVVYIRH